MSHSHARGLRKLPRKEKHSNDITVHHCLLVWFSQSASVAMEQHSLFCLAAIEYCAVTLWFSLSANPDYDLHSYD